MTQKDSLKKNTFLLTAGTFLNKGLQFLVIPFFSKWLTTEEYGEFDLLCTYVSLLIPVITLATQEAVFRFAVDDEDWIHRKVYITNAFVFQIFGYFVITFLLFFFRNKVGNRIYIIFSFYLFAELFSTFLRGYLRAVRKLDLYSVSMCVSTVFMAIFVTIFVYFFHMKLEGILLGYALGTFLGDLCICFLSRFHTMLLFNRIEIVKIKELITYSLPLIPNELAWWVMNASDRQLIHLFFGSTANGIYAITHKIPSLCSVLFSMFSVSWQQEAVGRIKDENREEYFNHILNSFLQLLLTVCSGLAAGSFIVYYYIFDVKYFEAILYSPILIFSSMLLAVSQFFGGIQIALKQPKQNGITTVIGAVLNILVHIGLYKYIGLYAAAISTLVANGMILFLRIIFLRNEFRVRIRKKTVFTCCGFLYFFFMSYLYDNMILNWFNLFAACLFFAFINQIIKKLRAIIDTRLP